MSRVKIAAVIRRCRAAVIRCRSALGGSVLGRHRWTLLIAVAALALSAPQWRIELMSMADWPWPRTALQLGIIALTALFAVIPGTAGVLIIASYSVAVLLPDPYMGANGWCLDVALGYIVYASRPAIGAGVTGYLVMMRLVEAAKAGGGVTPDMLIPLGSGCIVAALIGLLARHQRELTSLRQRELRMRQVERDLDVAHRLHDATSGELTSIGLMARLGLQAARSEEERELFSDIMARSDTALGHVHEVIRLLAGGDSGVAETGERDDRRESARNAARESGRGVDQDAARESWPGTADSAHPDDIRTLAGRVDRELHAAGFVGESRVHGPADDGGAGAVIVIDRSRLDLLAEVLREIRANVIRHCDPGDRRYALDIDVSGGSLDIRQTNPVAASRVDGRTGDQPGDQPGGRSRDRAGGAAGDSRGGTSDARPGVEPFAAGHGLALLRRRLSAVGGSVTASRRDGVWRLRVHVPSPTGDQGAGPIQ